VLTELYRWTHGPDSHLHDLLSTLQGATAGFALGTGAAIVCTLLFVIVPWTGRLFAAYIAAFNAIPKVVLAPLFILWFGVGLQAKMFFVASVIFIVMFYNMYVGVKSIDPIYLAQARVLGARRLWELRVVFIPAMMGWIIVSLRVSVAFALLSAVVSEYLAASHGIGHLISLGESTLRADQVLAGVVAVAIVTILVDALLRAAESRLTRWRVR
jgi:NitT/TauT family transport system permease protein